MRSARPQASTATENKCKNAAPPQVCNHPYLFNIDAEPDFDGETTGEDIVEASGKMQARAVPFFASPCVQSAA